MTARAPRSARSARTSSLRLPRTRPAKSSKSDGLAVRLTVDARSRRAARASCRCGCHGDRSHRLEGRAGEAPHDDHVERVVIVEGPRRLVGIRRRHTHGARRSVETGELPPISVVEVAVEGLLLRETLPGVMADSCADVAE